jgi:anti-sigma factor RsiW
MPNETEHRDREGLLLLYAAGEMDAQQRGEFERLLASDTELAAQLAIVRAAQQRVGDELAELDRHERPPVSDAVATRRAMRAIQQWQVERSTSRRQTTPTRTLPLPWWMYPSAAAAALLIGVLVWSSRQEVPALNAPEQSKRNIELAAEEEDTLAEELDDSFAIEEVADLSLVRSDDVGAFFITPQEEQ